MSAAIDVLLEALHADPSDETAWLALADALEEDGQPKRAELTRLLRRRCDQTEPRVQELLQGSVRPCVPEWTNSLGMRFVLISAGSFRLGSPDDEEGRCVDEGPVHEVEVTRPFYLGVTPVTQEQYEKVMGRNPSSFSARGGGRDTVRGLDTGPFPVENVSWEKAMAFCKKLAEMGEEKVQRRVYTLPTEAQWEYACRGGAPSYSVFHFGDSLSSTQANFDGKNPYGGAATGNSLRRTCRVGSYPPNAFGLFDMHGNVCEWCADWVGLNYCSGRSPRQDPPGPSEGSHRLIRGGCWSSGGQGCRSACRRAGEQGFRGSAVGFRVVYVSAGR
jgi:uncharacterized protein (TIGR02996 family)